MNPLDIPMDWTLRLTCEGCGRPICDPNLSCPHCQVRKDCAYDMILSKGGIRFQ